MLGQQGRAAMITYHEIKHAHIFCGLGGGTRGFNNGNARVGSVHSVLGETFSMSAQNQSGCGQ